MPNTYTGDAGGAANSWTRADNADLSLTGDWTIEFWVRVQSWNGAGSNFFVGTNGTNGVQIYAQANGTGWVVQTDNANNHISTFNGSTNTWHHCAVVQSGTNVKLFVANAGGTHANYLDTTYTEHTDPTGDFKILGDATGKGAVPDADIEEVRVWNVARTTAELDSNFECELAGNEAGLVAYWKFENNENDSGPNGYTLTKNGTATYQSASVPFSAGTCGGGAASPMGTLLIMGVG